MELFKMSSGTPTLLLQGFLNLILSHLFLLKDNQYTLKNAEKNGGTERKVKGCGDTFSSSIKVWGNHTVSLMWREKNLYHEVCSKCQGGGIDRKVLEKVMRRELPLQAWQTWNLV
jgi:hypothetical protein